MKRISIPTLQFHQPNNLSFLLTKLWLWENAEGMLRQLSKLSNYEYVAGAEEDTIVGKQSSPQKFLRGLDQRLGHRGRGKRRNVQNEKGESGKPKLPGTQEQEKEEVISSFICLAQGFSASAVLAFGLQSSLSHGLSCAS